MLKATFLQSASSTSAYLVSLKPPQCHLSLVCIFHLSLLGVSQASSTAAFLSSASSISPYLVSLKPPQLPPFFRLHLPSLPTWCLSSHLKPGLSLVCIFHLSLLGVSQAISSPAFLSSASSTTPYLVSLKPPQAPSFFSLHLPPLPTWCLSSHLNATFLQSAYSTSPYLVSLKPPQLPPFFRLHLPSLPTWCLSSHLKRGLSLVCIFHLSLLGVSQATSSRPFFSLHLPPLPTWCLSSHLKCRLSLVCIFHLSLLGVSQATSMPPFFSLHLPPLPTWCLSSHLNAAFLQSASSTSPYLVSLKPPQLPPFFRLHLPSLPTWCLSSHLKRRPFFSLHLPPLPTWCLSSHLKCRLSLVCIFHLSLLGVSQATSSAAFLQSASSTSPYLVSLKPPQAPPFFSLHLPPLPTWCLSSHLKCRLSLVCIFHLSLLGVSQATSSAAFLQSASSISAYLVSLKPPQVPPFFSLHLPPLPTWCLSSHLKCRLSLVCIFHLSLLGVSQATSMPAFLQSASSTSPYLVSLKPPHHWCLSSHLPAFLQSASPYLVSLKPPQARPFFRLHLPPLPTWCLSSHLKRRLSLVFIFHISLLGVSQATSSAAFLQSASSISPYLVSLKPPQSKSASSTSPYLVSLKPPQCLSLVCIFHLSLLGVSQATSMPPFFSLHLPPLPTWCLSSHLNCRLSLVCIFHLSLLGVSQATSTAAFLQSASSISPYLVSLKPPQARPFFSLHLPPLPTWCLSSHLKPGLSLVCIFHHSLLGVSQATSSAAFLQSASSTSPYLVSLKPPQCHLSLVCIFHLSLLGVSQATSTAAFLQSASSISPYLVSLKPPQARPFFSLHLPPLPTWCLSSHLKPGLSFVCIFHHSLLGVSQATSSAVFLQSSSSTSPYLVSLKPPQVPPFFSLHLPSLPTWCLSSHINATFLQSASSTSPYLVSLKPPQCHLSLVCIFHLCLLGVSQATSMPPFFSLHLPPLPTWCLSSLLNCRLSFVCIFHLSLLGVSQASSTAAFLSSASSISPYLVSLKPPQARPFFSLHLPPLPTWCLSSHLKPGLSFVCIFHHSLLGVSQATSSAVFLQSSSSTSAYLVSLKPPQCHLSLVCIFHLSLLGVSQASSTAAFLSSASSISPYLVSLKPPQARPFFSLHLPPLPTWCLSSHLKPGLSFVCIFHLSLLGVSQATSSAVFLQSASSTSPYLVSLKPPQVPPFFSLHLPSLPTWCLSSHLNATFLQSASSTSPYLVSLKPPQCHLSLASSISLLGVSQATSMPSFCIFHLSLLGVSQATSMPPFFSLHLPSLPTWCLSSHLNCRLSLVCIFHLSLLGVSQATSSRLSLVCIFHWCLSSHLSLLLSSLVSLKPPQARLSLVCIFHLSLLGVSLKPPQVCIFLSLSLKPPQCIFHLSLLGVSQATSSAAFLQSASSTSPYLVSLKPPQARPFFSLHLPPLPTWCLSSHLNCRLSLVCISPYLVSLKPPQVPFLQSASSISPYLVSLKPHQCFHLSLLGVSQATSSPAFLQSASSTSPYLVSLKPPQAPPFFSLHLPPLPTWCLSSHLKRGLSFVCIFHLSLLGVSQATSSAAFLSSASSISPYLVSLKPPQARPFFSLHLPPLPTWCLSSHLKPGLSLVCIFHLSLLGVSQATSSAVFLQSASSTSPYLVSLKPPQCHLSLVCIFHLSLLGVSQATSTAAFLSSASSISPYLVSLKPPQAPAFLQSASSTSLPTWCLSSHLKPGLSFVCIFHLSLLGVSQATSSAAFLSSASSTSPYLVSLKPPQAPPFFSLHLPPLPTWCLSSHLKCRLSLVCIFHLSLLGVSQATSMPPFFSLHLPPLPTWCLSSHLKCRLSLVCIFHLSLLGVSQATSSAAFLQSASSISPYLVSLKPPQATAFLQSASSISPYLVSLKPPQARPFFSLHLPPLPTWCLSSHLKPGLSFSASSTSPYLVSLKPPQVPPFFSLHLPPLPTCVSQATSSALSLVCIFHLSLLGVSQATSRCLSSHLKCRLSLVCIFHLSLLGVSQATSMPPFFSLHLPPLPTWCLSSHLKRRLSLVCIFHLSLLGVSQATSSAAFLQSASSISPYLVSLKPPQCRPFFSLHLPPLPTWCLSSHLKPGLSLVCIFHLSLLGVSQATSSAAFLQSASSTSPYLVSLKPPQCRLSLVCIFHLSLLGVSQATSSAAFLQSASSTSPYLVSLKPPQVPPFFSLHLPSLPTWCLSSHLNAAFLQSASSTSPYLVSLKPPQCRLSLVCIFHLSLLGVSQATSMPPFFSLHLPPLPTWCLSSHLKPPFFSLHLPSLPTWCLSSHLKRRLSLVCIFLYLVSLKPPQCHLSLVCIFHLSLLGVSQATSSPAFLQSASSTSPYLVSLKPPQAPSFFSLHLPPLPTWCLSSHLKPPFFSLHLPSLPTWCLSSHINATFLQSASQCLSLLGVSQATSMPPFFSLHLPPLPTWCLSSHLNATFLQSASSTSPYLVSLKPPQLPPFFRLHLPSLPTWCLSSLLNCRLSFVCIFHLSLLGVSQATSSPAFLQSASSTSPYLVSLKPSQARPFFRLHLPPLPTWCLSSHLKRRLSLVFIFHLCLLGVSQATSMPPFFSLHIPPLPTWCLSSLLNCRLSFVCIFHLSLLGVSQATSSPPFFSLHLPPLPTWCLHLSLLGVSQATSSAGFLSSASSTSPYLVSLKPPQARPFFRLHLPPLSTWCLSSHLKRGLSFVCIFHLSLLGVSQATSSAAFLQSASSTSPYLVSLKPPQCGLSLVCIFHLCLLGISQATSSAAFLQSASSTSPYLVSLKPPQAPPFFSLHLPSLPTWCLSSHLKCHLSLVCIFHSPYLVSLKPPQVPPFFSLHLPPLPTWCLSSHLNAAFLSSASSISPYLVSLKPPQCRLSLVCIFHLSLLGVSQATSSAAFLQSASSTSPYLVSLKPPQVPPFFSLHLPHLPTWCLSSHLKCRLSLVCIFHLSLLGVSQATSMPPFFSLHLPSLPTWCLSSHLNAAFLQSASSISPYLVSLKPPQCRLSLVCIFHLSLLGVSQATSMPPFFSLHLPSLPTWCLSSHLNAAFLQSASSISPYLVSLKPPQCHLSLVCIFHLSLLGVSQATSMPPFFSLHLPPLPTWCLSSHLKCGLSLVCIFHLSLLGVSQATSSAAFLQSASSTSPYLVSLKPPQVPPFFSLHLPSLPTWCLSSHLNAAFLQSASSISPYLVSLKPPQCRLSLVCIFHLSLLGVSQATSMPPFFSLHLPPLPTWCLSSHLKCRLSLVCIFHLSLLGVSQATSSATFLQYSTLSPDTFVCLGIRSSSMLPACPAHIIEDDTSLCLAPPSDHPSCCR